MSEIVSLVQVAVNGIQKDGAARDEERGGTSDEENEVEMIQEPS